MAKFELKIGDRIRVKDKIWYDSNKDHSCTIIVGGAIFYYNMSQFCDKIVTIKNKFGTIYTIEEDKGVFNWTQGMFEMPLEDSQFDINDKVETDEGLYGVVDKVWWNCDDNTYIYEVSFGDVDFGRYTECRLKPYVETKFTQKAEENNKADSGEISDGYHTFNELYEYRMLYNATYFNELAKQGLYDVHKSRMHSDGDFPFGNPNYFIVIAELPTGQISNHYDLKDWDLFDVPEKEKANKWDCSTPKDVAERLRKFLTPKKEYPKTYEECCKVLGFLNVDLCFNAEYRSFNASKEQWERLGLMNQLYQLLICRNAYWKIAGEERGLGKPWEPSASDYITGRYCIFVHRGNIICDTPVQACVLTFPTSEMRDAFYENFKKLIDECKELL